MPRRATSTSYGGKAGNTPNTTIPGPGRPENHARQRAAESWAQRIYRLEQIADGKGKGTSPGDSIAAMRALAAVGFTDKTEIEHSGKVEVAVTIAREGRRRTAS